MSAAEFIEIVNALYDANRHRLCRRGFPLQSGAAAACVTDSHPGIANGL